MSWNQELRPFRENAVMSGWMCSLTNHDWSSSTSVCRSITLSGWGRVSICSRCSSGFWQSGQLEYARGFWRFRITRPVAALPLIHLVTERFREGLLLLRAWRNDGQSTDYQMYQNLAPWPRRRAVLSFHHGWWYHLTIAVEFLGWLTSPCIWPCRYL